MHRSHPTCSDPDCRVCLHEHLTLGEVLRAKTGIPDDHLAAYRRFWESKTGLCAETQHGWSDARLWTDDNIAAYIAHRVEGA